MSSQYYAGIDYSMNSPAITVGLMNSKFSECKSFYYTKSKRLTGQLSDMTFGILHLPYESQMERFDNISNWAMTILNKFDIKSIVLEGYSMGSHNGILFDIAENTAFLKYKMFMKKIEVFTPAPTQVKKFFSGKGNAKKEDMYAAFRKENDVDLEKTFNMACGKNPVSDIVDSYAMLKYGFQNCF